MMKSGLDFPEGNAGSMNGQGHPSGYHPPQQQQQLQQQQPIPQPSSVSPQRNSNTTTTSNSGNGPRAKCDQVVFEAIAKAAEIVVASRCRIGNDPLAAGQTGFGRFNLLVPEVKSVRNILQRWKRTMHVPLRLDVYYQHPPKDGGGAGERELLERWCLEYAPTTSASAPAQIQLYNSGTDPIVQLRRVCKSIVVWLRTLYCHSRLLPAQALRKNYMGGDTNTNTTDTGNSNSAPAASSNTNIGFSIYVVGEGQDDVSMLLKQGFDSAPKSPSNGVPTPYGVMGWRVYMAPRELIRKLVELEKERARLLRQQLQEEAYAQNNNYANTTTQPQQQLLPPTRPIPMPQPQQQYQHQHQHQQHQQTFGTPPTGPLVPPVARSAPANHRVYRRSNSDSVAAHTHIQQQQQQQPQAPNQQQQQQQQQHLPPEQTRYYSRSPGQHLLGPRSYHPESDFQQRRNTTSFTGRGLYPDDDTRVASPSSTSRDSEGDSPNSRDGSNGIRKSKQNPSALSLALMTMKDDPQQQQQQQQDQQSKGEQAEDPAIARRAALHNAPPVGDYGYAYNNHSGPHGSLPQQHPTSLSSSPATPSFSHFRGPSTPSGSTFGTTPPGYLLGATPSVGSHTGTPMGGGMLLPPSRSAGAQPPFVRAPGFAVQPPQQLPVSEDQQTAQQQQQPSPEAATTANNNNNNNNPEDPLPSFDRLHSSPFHHSVVASSMGHASSFLQAEENASVEAATTFINDFYHHHYPMAQGGGFGASAGEDTSGIGGEEHPSLRFGEATSSALASAFGAVDPHHHDYSSYSLHQQLSSTSADNDMPFAVDNDASPQGSQALASLGSLRQSEAAGGGYTSLMAASMGMVPQKKLALFESSAAGGAENSGGGGGGGDANDDVDALADFRSFGATLSAATTSLTTSVGSGG